MALSGTFKNAMFNLIDLFPLLSKQHLKIKYTVFLGSAFTFHFANAQTNSAPAKTQVAIAGKHYEADRSFQKLWGRHYRKEWAMPVALPVINLDTVAGGLTPVKLGGGRQSKTLHLVNSKGKPYVLRSIDKDLSPVIPEIYKGTFVQMIANDQVSIAHPYAALTVPKIIEATGVYHTNPQIVYVPAQSSLGEYNKEFANTICLLEERPEGNQEDAANFGNSKNVIGTDELLENLTKDNHQQVDQKAYVKARLFDMFIGDWGRHEDQWRWASFDQNGQTVYKPIPRDRDQLYTKFDGTMLTLFLKMAGLGHLESFDYKITNAAEYNFPARNLDARLTNEVTHDQWLTIAKELKKQLTNAVIEQGVRQLPREIYPISGKEIIAKLKSRRDHLVKVADSYYKYLAYKVNVTGSSLKDRFEVERLSNGETSVKIFAIGENGQESTPYYARTFQPKETKEIRIFGLGESDLINLAEDKKDPIKIRIMPGPGSDSVVDKVAVNGNNNIRIYDTEGSAFTTSAKVHLSGDSIKNNYNYSYNRLDIEKKGLTIKPGNRFGVGFRVRTERWGKRPYGIEHSLIGYYTITRGGLALEYRTRIPELIGKWNFEIGARSEFPYVAHFFGVGNNSPHTNDTNRYYRMRIYELYGGLAINRLIDSSHFIEFRPFYQSIKIKNDQDKFIGKESHIPVNELERKYFAGAEAQYSFIKTNDRHAPTRGINFNITGGYTQNVKDNSRSFTHLASSVSVYLPVTHNLVFATRAGGATIKGDAEFYQLAKLGGNENLRGFLRERFYGKSSFYNNNELRWMLNFKSYFFNGTVALIGFLDNGRVWQPGETSGKWHVGYGPGIVIAPFNKLWVNAAYGISADDTVFHLQVGFFF